MTAPDKVAATRAFIRDFNILVKQVGMYGPQHQRAAAQFRTTWKNLREALKGQPALQIGVAGERIVLDGAQFSPGPAERGLMQFFSSAGIAGIRFLNTITEEEFARLVRAFSAKKPSEVLPHVKQELNAGLQHSVRVLEPQFMSAGSVVPEAGVSAQLSAAEIALAADLAVSSLGSKVHELAPWLSDPRKLLQLLVGAEGAGHGPAAKPAPEGGVPVPTEEDVMAAIHWLTLLGSDKQATRDSSGVETVARVPAEPRRLLRDTLESLLTKPDETQAETPLLVRLAEHVAIRFAMQRYQQGDTRIDAVRQTLARMSQATEALRKLLRCHEDVMRRAGLPVENHADLLHRQFWAGVPDWGKQRILLSGDAWCVPPTNIRSFIGELHEEHHDTAREILQNYCRQLENSDPEARRKVAVGVGDMAGLLGNFGLLQEAVARIAQALSTGGSNSPDFVTALVLLMQEAGNKRDYGALEESFSAIEKLQAHSPTLANDIRVQIAVEERVPDFIQEALGSATPPPDLVKLLSRMPAIAASEIIARFGRAAKRHEPERLLALLNAMGGEVLEQVRQTFRSGSPQEAVATVGLLSRTDIFELENFLPARLAQWNWPAQRECVRLLAIAGAAERGSLLLKLLGSLHSFVLPGAIDEIGVCGKLPNPAKLVEIAQGGAAAQQSPYLQVKAVEALGILQETSAVPVLTNLLTAKRWNWEHPRELRIAAAQALLQIDPQNGRKLADGSGLDQAELKMLPLSAKPGESWARPRRYVRVNPERVVVGIAKFPGGECRLAVDSLSLSGGLGTSSFRGLQTTDAALELQVGFRPVRAHVLLREVRPHQCAFEILDIDLEDRLRLRRFLIGQPEESAARQARAGAAGTATK